jgi:hypothetical protein
MTEEDSPTERLIQVVTQFPGLTLRALLVLHDIAPSLIYRCVQLGLIETKRQTMGHRSGCLYVFRFYAAKQGVSK